MWAHVLWNCYWRAVSLVAICLLIVTMSSGKVKNFKFIVALSCRWIWWIFWEVISFPRYMYSYTIWAQSGITAFVCFCLVFCPIKRSSPIDSRTKSKCKLIPTKLTYAYLLWPAKRSKSDTSSSSSEASTNLANTGNIIFIIYT